MYSFDRYSASEMLGISTRTLDRYVRSGKIRSKKKGKKVFLNDQDIEIMKSGGIQEEYEILEPKIRFEENEVMSKMPVKDDFKRMYEESLRTIDKKEEIIKDLSFRLGKAEIELKNSIPMLEYKKTTFLLESTNSKASEEKKELIEKVDGLKEKVRTQELINVVLAMIFSIMLLVVFMVWFANI